MRLPSWCGNPAHTHSPHINNGGCEMPKLTDREFAMLGWLEDEKFEAPMLLGGRDGSHHSVVLAGLVRKGLAERKKYHSITCPRGITIATGPEAFPKRCCCKGSCQYRRTPEGAKEHERLEAAGRYVNPYDVL